MRRREPKASEAPSAEAEREALRANAYEFFATGMLGNIGERNLQPKSRGKPVGDVNEIKIEGRRKKRLREYDRLLKSFKYRAALDSVLSKVRVCVVLFRRRLGFTGSHLLESPPNGCVFFDSRASSSRRHTCGVGGKG